MEFCDTYVKDRPTPKGNTGKDLWCRTHHMWVYQASDSELLNSAHERVRWDTSSPLLP